MKQTTVALWMYRNDGGAVVQDKLKQMLEVQNCCVVNDFDMRECYCLNGRVLTKEGYDLSQVDVLYHMNADEQTEYQNDILRVLELSGVNVVNGWNAFSTAKDKFATNTILRKKGINVPPAIFLNGKQAYLMAEQIFKKWKAICVKPRKNHGGKGIIRFTDVDNFKDFIEVTDCSSYYIEKYIEFGIHDYRVEIFRGKVVGSYCRLKQHSFKTNMAVGGLFSSEVPSVSFEKIALISANALNIDTTIIDMIKSKHDGKIYVLEVNPIMGIFVEAFLNDSPQSKATEIDSKHQNDDLKLKHLVRYLASFSKRKVIQ